MEHSLLYSLSSESKKIPLITTKIRAALELMRPANIITAFADILAGFAAAGGVMMFADGAFVVTPGAVGWLLLSTFGLYGGGVVFNDVFDAELDAKERPERAIPSGRFSLQGAVFLGAILLLSGIGFAFFVNETAGFLAVAIALCALFYDAKAKHSVLWGPLFMGLCRGGNLLLGCAVVPALLPQLWFLALLPLAYIGSITLISRGEVGGGSKRSGYLALGLVILVIGGLVALAFLPDFSLIPSAGFILLFAAVVVPAFLYAARRPEAEQIRKAVKRGVISLVLMNSALAAGFAGLFSGLIILMLFALSIMISKMFAVT